MSWVERLRFYIYVAYARPIVESETKITPRQLRCELSGRVGGSSERNVSTRLLCRWNAMSVSLALRCDSYASSATGICANLLVSIRPPASSGPRQLRAGGGVRILNTFSRCQSAISYNSRGGRPARLDKFRHNPERKMLTERCHNWTGIGSRPETLSTFHTRRRLHAWSVLLPVSHSVCLSVCLSVRPSVCLSVCLSVCRPSIRLSVRPSVCLSVRPSVCLSVLSSVCLSVCLCAGLL